uniref:Uncharacterized protein n=1 Tax=Cucumis melo TaxID=3656 RepID=A0A9I9EJC5_CUCME
MRLGADVLVFFHCNGSDQRGFNQFLVFIMATISCVARFQHRIGIEVLSIHNLSLISIVAAFPNMYLRGDIIENEYFLLFTTIESGFVFSSFWILHCCREMMSAVMRVPYGCCFKKYLVKLTMRLHEVCNTRKDTSLWRDMNSHTTLCWHELVNCCVY